MLKRNLIANYLGQSWAAFVGLAFTPLYIKYLGIESYSFIGLFAVLTAWLNLLDMGMTPTLGREMARFTGGHHTAQSIRDLLRTIEWLAFTIAVLIAAGVALASAWIASSWLKIEAMPIEVAAQAFVFMGLVTALRFIETIYRSCIVSLQHQVLFNMINSGWATVRGLGAAGVLAWISPTIQAFFIWQGVISLFTLGTLAAITYSILPSAEHGARFSPTALLGVWRFAGGMTGISFLALLLMQADKILLSKLLSLSEYGHYTLAAVVASAIYMLISPITQALFPRLCELHARNNNEIMIETFHLGAQLVTVLAGSVAIVIIIFPETLLRLWTMDHTLAAHSAPLLRLLTLGNLLNGLMWIPYQTQLAHGWTSLTIRINILAVLFVVPALLWVTPRYGAEGAAWVWVGLNAGYVLIGVQFMYRKILREQRKCWYLLDLLLPLTTGSIVALTLKAIWPATSTPINELILILLTVTLTTGATLLSADQLRRQAITWLTSYLRRQKNSL